jgi:hypothetical protein
MKKLILLLFLAVTVVLRTNAQETKPAVQYKVPSSYNFDYKVVYNIDLEDKKGNETMTYYFTKSGDYMSMEPPENDKEKEMNFMVNTKDGMMITFVDKAGPNTPGKNGKTVTVMDMRSMFKGGAETAAAIAKNMPKKENTEAEKKKPNEQTSASFEKTGRTKQFFGYTADEYSREFTGEDKGKMRSGTVSVWYAKVDFDPEMMFSMGLGSLGGGGQSQSKLNHSTSLGYLGLGLTQKNYLMVELDFAEKGGDHKTGMKVINIEKTNFSKSTAGYSVENYSGMSMKEMMQKEMEKK